jgi:hypothetical protein
MHSVFLIVLPHLELSSQIRLLAVSKKCRKVALDFFRETNICNAVAMRFAPSRLNEFLLMHENLTFFSFSIGKNNFRFDHILLCSSTLVGLTVLHLHDLHSIADADIAHVLRVCKRLRIVELHDAAHAGTLSLLALASSCRHLRRVHISAALTSIVNDLLTRELTSTCFLTPLEALEFPMCFKFSLTAMRHIVAQFGGAMFSRLDLSGCLNLGDSGICAIVNLCSRLETFIAKFSPASDCTCQALSHCSNLTALDLSGSLPTRKGLVALAPLAATLHSLALSRCSAINDANLCELMQILTNVKFMDVTGCSAISYSTILLLEKLAPHATIKHSTDHYHALENAVEVLSFIQPISQRAEAFK